MTTGKIVRATVVTALLLPGGAAAAPPAMGPQARATLRIIASVAPRFTMEQDEARGLAKLSSNAPALRVTLVAVPADRVPEGQLPGSDRIDPATQLLLIVPE